MTPSCPNWAIGVLRRRHLRPSRVSAFRPSHLRRATQGMARAFVSVGCFHVIGFRLAGDLVDLQRRKNYSAKETVRVGTLTGKVGEYWPGLILVSPPEFR